MQATQQAFADKVGTSQSTVAAYESGAKSPTLKTLARFAAAYGLELDIDFTAMMTREDRRSLMFHVAIAEVLDRDPRGVLAKAKDNLVKLRELHPHARDLLDRWHRWLALPVEDLKGLMLGTSASAREMRHVSPFAGLLEPRERARLLARFRRTQAA